MKHNNIIIMSVLALVISLTGCGNINKLSEYDMTGISFIEYNDIDTVCEDKELITAEAEGNYAVTGGQTKSDWISVNLGVSQRTVQRWLKEIQNKKESPEEEKPVTKSDDKPSKSATPEDPDAPGKEDIAQAKDILSSKFASVNVTKGKITFKFETKDDLAELVEMLTGIEMAV